jgi:valyl-tRNA synthetase
VIIQPPPNVTGSLHLGHAQRSAVEDLMTRHSRMQGRPALFLPGLDHASIAAQFVLDKLIAAEGQTRASLGRDRYLERMWRFIHETREIMLGQQRRVGASVDWGRLRFTMDEMSSAAVREAFKRLYDDGLACPGGELGLRNGGARPTHPYKCECRASHYSSPRTGDESLHAD